MRRVSRACLLAKVAVGLSAAALSLPALTSPARAQSAEDGASEGGEEIAPPSSDEAAAPGSEDDADATAEETASAPVKEPPKDDLSPKDRQIEIGLLTGPLLISGAHNLEEERFPHRKYSNPAWLLGLRAAYFMTKNGGLEVEYAHGWGSVAGSASTTLAGASGAGAQFNTFRGHLIAQLSGSRFVPFLLLGAGVLQASSDRLGTDGDFLLEGGLGAKLALNKFFLLRLDGRLEATQKEGGVFSDGIAIHGEVLLGGSFMLNR